VFSFAILTSRLFDLKHVSGVENEFSLTKRLKRLNRFLSYYMGDTWQYTQQLTWQYIYPLERRTVALSHTFHPWLPSTCQPDEEALSTVSPTRPKYQIKRGYRRNDLLLNDEYVVFIFNEVLIFPCFPTWIFESSPEPNYILWRRLYSLETKEQPYTSWWPMKPRSS
jgi:hypothetical protein